MANNNNNNNNVTIYGSQGYVLVSVLTARKWKSNATGGSSYQTSLSNLQLGQFRDYLVHGQWYATPDDARNICALVGITFNSYDCPVGSASNSGMSLTPATSYSGRSLTPAYSTSNENNNNNRGYWPRSDSDDEY